jgi:hypothetical protein
VSSDPQPRQAAIQRALNRIGQALLDRNFAVADAVLAAARTELSDVAPRESAAALSRSRREEMMAELRRLEAEGRAREAPVIVARQFARDRADQVEIDSLARKLRRWRAQKSGQCPSVAP